MIVNSCVPPLVECLSCDIFFDVDDVLVSAQLTEAACRHSDPRMVYFTLSFLQHVPVKLAESAALPRGMGVLGGLHPVWCALRLWHHSSPTFSAVWIQSGGGEG